VHVLLHGGARDHLGRLVQPRVDYFEAGIAERAGDHLCATVVAVEARLRNQHTNLSFGHGLPFGRERARRAALQRAWDAGSLGELWGCGQVRGGGRRVSARAEARSVGSRGAAEGAESVAGPGCVRREPERSSPGSTFVLNVVSAGGIRDHPAAQPAGRGRLHPANADPPGPNHESPDHAAKSPQRQKTRSTPPRPRPRPRPGPLKRTSAISASPRSMRAIVKGRAPPGRTPSLFSFGDQPRSLIGPRAFRGRGLGVLLARRRSLLPHRSSLVRASGSRGPTASADRILKANHGSI